MTDDEIIDYWDGWASTEERARQTTGDDDPVMTAACLGFLTRFLPDAPSALLEIGCGIGRLTVPIANLYIEDQTTVVGIDASEKMLARATSRVNCLVVGATVRLYQATRPDAFLFPAETYDGAWTVLTFQHLSSERAAEYVRAVGDALRDDGVFVFQFIEGTEREPFSNHFSWQEVGEWLSQGEMRVEGIQHGLGHELWTWVVARRNRR